jgi:hypothetical protein
MHSHGLQSIANNTPEEGSALLRQQGELIRLCHGEQHLSHYIRSEGSTPLDVAF